MNGGVHLRGGQESCINLQNLRIAHGSIIESRSVDKGHYSSIESELICEFDLGSTRLQAQSNS